VLLEHLVTVWAQKTAMPEPSITPTEYKSVHLEVEKRCRLLEHEEKKIDNHLVNEQRLAAVNRVARFIPGILYKFTRFAHNRTLRIIPVYGAGSPFCSSQAGKNEEKNAKK
jgi:hypothetical protein